MKIIITEQQYNAIIRYLNEQEEEEQKRAAGVYPIAKSTGRILLQQRGKNINNPLEWTNWGGKADPGESPKQNAVREFREESGYKGDVELVKSFVFENPDVKFSNYFGIVPNEFTPPMVGKKTVDGVVEVENYKWVSLNQFLNFKGKFHRGVSDFIKNALPQLRDIIDGLEFE